MSSLSDAVTVISSALFANDSTWNNETQSTSDNGTSLFPWGNGSSLSVWDNDTIAGNGSQTQSVCVMCRYYLDPWVKGIRVGFGSLIVLANIATFILLWKSRTLQMALRYFLLNVAVVDGMYGFGFLYHSAIVDFPQFIVMNFECKIRYGMLCMVSMVALFTLMAMCVERVLALKFAFSYHRIITRTNLLIGLVIFWAIPIAIVTPTYIMMDSSVGECNFVRFISAESFVVFAVSYFTFMVIAVICQLILLCITKSHIRKIIPTLVGDQREKAAFKMNLKATSTTLALAVPFVICATPKVLTYMYLAFNPRERIKVESLTMLAVTVYLNVSNSLINPLVYCWRLSEMRKQILAIFGKKMSQNTSSDPAVMSDKGKNYNSTGSGQGGCSNKQETGAEQEKENGVDNKDTFKATCTNFNDKFENIVPAANPSKINSQEKNHESRAGTEPDYGDLSNNGSPYNHNQESCGEGSQVPPGFSAHVKKFMNNLSTENIQEDAEDAPNTNGGHDYVVNKEESNLWGIIL